jgi:hypothetical protein
MNTYMIKYKCKYVYIGFRVLKQDNPRMIPPLLHPSYTLILSFLHPYHTLITPLYTSIRILKGENPKMISSSIVIYIYIYICI